LVVFNHSPLEASNADTLLACDGWPCKTTSIAAIRAYKTADAQAGLPSASSIKIDATLGTINAKDATFTRSNPSPDGMFAFPSIIKYAAQLSLSNKNSSAVLSCAHKTNGVCDVEFLRDTDLFALAFKDRSDFKSISDSALAHVFLNGACQPDCDQDKLTKLFDFDGWFYALNVRGSPFIALRRTFSRDPKTQEFHAVDSIDSLNTTDLTATKSLPVVAQLSGLRLFDLWNLTISHTLLEDLLTQITKAGTGASIRLWASSEQYASAIVNDNGSSTVWSAVQQNGKTCLRSLATSAVISKLNEWSQKGFVDTAYAAKLSKAEDELMRRLAEPTLAGGEFNLSPLLLFGDPAQSCK
jgi:hypothetical protein